MSSIFLLTVFFCVVWQRVVNADADVVMNDNVSQEDDGCYIDTWKTLAVCCFSGMATNLRASNSPVSSCLSFLSLISF